MNTDSEALMNLFNEFSVWTFVQIAMIVLVSLASTLILRFLIPRIAEMLPARFRLIALNILPLARVTIFVFAVGLIVPLIFNVTLKNFVLVLGTLGVALGFAVKDWATSAVAGFVAIFERPYRSGDWVRIDQDYGEVIELGTRSIKLRTANDDVVTIPHSRIWDENIINANNGKNTLLCVASFMIAADKPADNIIELLRDIAFTSPYLDWEKPVSVILQNAPHATTVQLKAYPFEMRDQFDFITDLTQRGRDALLAEGIEIVMTPEFTPAMVQSTG
ncbi:MULTISPECIES: mechanosensitive ion channel family protein [Halocynthiibacter]|uniref:Small-conductance mechanosensitive channel n=1 Tax=Halocynthiibacter halioticoli TaxID=2986804 RepID=A0AAE3LRV6_9RHOB|nr:MULTISPECIES: mechanosensitive ion channel family protein [Halocynthiibacter]MCV6824864.1 mechanosensitive ion channel family protein [Halocynthiibacter halioticoli]MCW4057865.1 mechanosensitive ion channel family protein [Halocynthiibacter sp. SDUM655004]